MRRPSLANPTWVAGSGIKSHLNAEMKSKQHVQGVQSVQQAIR